jgi:hypothetical protein
MVPIHRPLAGYRSVEVAETRHDFRFASIGRRQDWIPAHAGTRFSRLFNHPAQQT